MAFVVVNDSMNCTFDISHSSREITTKESSGNRGVAEGLKSGSFSIEGLVDGSGYDNAIENAYFNRQQITVRWDSNVVGDTEYEAACFVTSFNRTAGNEDNDGYNATFDITGAVSETIIT